MVRRSERRQTLSQVYLDNVPRALAHQALAFMTAQAVMRVEILRRRKPLPPFEADVCMEVIHHGPSTTSWRRRGAPHRCHYRS